VDTTSNIVTFYSKGIQFEFSVNVTSVFQSVLRCDIPVPNNSAKFALYLFSWEFTRPSNLLYVTAQVSINNGTNSLQLINSTVENICGGGYLITRYYYSYQELTFSFGVLNFVEIDGGIKNMTVQLENNNQTINFIFPSFTNYLSYDPDYSVFLSYSNNNNNGDSTSSGTDGGVNLGLAIGVSVGVSFCCCVVLLAAIIIMAVYIIRKNFTASTSFDDD